MPMVYGEPVPRERSQYARRAALSSGVVRVASRIAYAATWSSAAVWSDRLEVVDAQ